MPDAAVAHDDRERVGARVHVDLQRSLRTAVGMQHDVVARLGDGRVEIVGLDRVVRQALGHAGQRLAYEQDVLRPVEEAQADVRMISAIEQRRSTGFAPSGVGCRLAMAPRSSVKLTPAALKPHLE